MLVIKKAIIYIFYDTKNKKYLIENRTDKQIFPREKVFPGGKVENTEIDDLTKTLLREIKEETGVDATEYFSLKYSGISEVGYKLYPFLITKWKGTISDKVLDKGSKLEWIDMDKFEPTLKSVQQILKKANDWVAHSC